MYRWSACPGSVRLCEGIESKSSSYAQEGTLAHDVAAKALQSGKYAAQLCADVEMAEAVQVYVSYVWEHCTTGYSNDRLWIEHRFDLSFVHPGLFGTADAVIWKADEQLLIVVDYKHGAGIHVKVEGNPQGLYYALGALLTMNLPAKRVRIVVVQPRCGAEGEKIRSWEIDAVDLLDFQADLIAYARATESPDAPLVPGEHCRFCPAAATCPALASRAQSVARLEFKQSLPYDPAQLKLALDSREAVKAWLKAVDEFAYAEAEAGRTPPGYKLVAKRANRKWRSEGEAIEYLQDVLGVKPEVMFERSLKSPAQLEKVVEAKMFADHVVKESSGHTLVPEDDKRPAVKVSAAAEFLE